MQTGRYIIVSVFPLFLFLTIQSSTTNKNKPLGSTEVVTNEHHYHSPVYYNHNFTNLHSSNTLAQEQTQIQTTQVTFNLEIKERLKKMGDCANGSFVKMLSCLGHNKLKAAFYMTFSSYILVKYKMCNFSRVISSDNSWCNWKQVIPLEQLVIMPIDDLILQLHFAVRKKYLLVPNCPLSAEVSMLFMQEVKIEKDALKNYQKLYGATKAFRCSGWFFSHTDIFIVNEKVARLSFILDLFMRWQGK